MAFLKRIFFFLLVNTAVIAVMSLILSIFNVQPYLTPYGLNYQSLLIFAALFGFTGSFISLFLSKFMAKWMTKVKVIDQPKGNQEAHLIHIVENIAQQLNIGRPDVGIYPSSEVNAFATGWNKNKALVAVSEGLLRERDQNEIEGVLAHEMAHIANGDMITMTLIQGVVNTFVIFAARIVAYVIQIALSRGDQDSGAAVGGFAYHLTAILFEIVFSILASTIVFWVSRRREFAADRGGAKFVGKSKMIAALQKLQTLTHKIDSRQKSLATMKIADRKGWSRAFSSHPPMEERIAALQKAQIQ